MINKKSVDEVNSSTFGKYFHKPLYETYSLANIANSVVSKLTSKGIGTELPEDVFESNEEYDHIFLFFLDAFGWQSYEKFKKESTILQSLSESGIVSKLTSMFPSTTTACVTSLHTGKATNQSSMIAWRIYDPIVDEIIYPFLYRRVTDDKAGELLKDLDPAKFYPKSSIYNTLVEHNVSSYVYGHQNFTPSPFTETTISPNAEVIPFEDYKEGIASLTKRALNSKVSKSYTYFYLHEADGASHKYGPDSDEFKASSLEHLKAIEELFLKKVSGKLKNSLFILMADHGQTRIDVENPYYINKLIPDIEKYLHHSKAGRPLIPAGSARDMFLYVKNETRLEMQTILNNKLKGVAEAHLTEDLLDNNIFGSKQPTKEFLDRVGNLVILPYKDNAVWWYEEGKFSIDHIGMHGGLSKSEMEIPFFTMVI